MATRRGLVNALAIGLCVSAFGAGYGWAEEPEPAKTEPTKTEPKPKSGAIEEITVRARKVAEKEQSTPVALTPYSEEAMEREVTFSVSDLGGAPNVMLTSLGAFNATAFAIRGGSFQDIESSFEPAVGVVMDGMYLGRNSGALLNLYDTESVEVLRGPQGVLFGRNSTSGMVVVRSRRPSGDLSQRGNVTVGDRGFRDYRLALDVPIVPEKVAANISFLKEQSEGSFRNHAGGKLFDKDYLGMRSIVEFTPTDAFDLTVIWDNFKDRSGGAPLNPASPPGSLFAAFGFVDDGGSLFGVDQEMQERNRMDYSDLIFDMNYDLGPVTFTSITGWRSAKEDIWTDFDAEPIVLFETKRPQDAGQFSQELRAAGDLIDDVLNLTLGYYYYDAHYTLNGSTTMDACVFLPGCPSGAPGVASFSTVGRAHQDMYSNGYFGQLIWTVTPIMHAYAGGRWTVDDKTFDIMPSFLTLGGAGSAHDDARFRKFTPKVGMDFQITPDLFGWMQYSTGFRAGGYNGRAARIVPESVGPYDSETRGSIETGIKSDWLDRHLRVNVTGFYDRYRDMQLPVIVPTGNPISPQETLTQNAGNAEIWGLELETISKPLDELTVWGSMGYLHAKYLKFDADLDGNGTIDDNTDLDLMRTPKYYMHVETLYEFPLMDFGMLGVHAGWTYFSHQATTVRNAPMTNVTALSLYDGSLIYSPMDSDWRFTLYGKNLFNRVTEGGGLEVANLFAFNGPIAPRTYGLNVSWQYDDLGSLFSK